MKENIMANVTFKGVSVKISGNLPPVGSKAPDFKLTKEDLSDVSLNDFKGKKKILNIVPSLDTGVCAASARKFDREIANLSDTVLLTISNDLPFAMSRFCKIENLEHIISLSQMRDRKFSLNWGIELIEGPLAGLLARAVVILDTQDNVAYVELVSEIGHEPNYDAALEVLRRVK
jgi:thiol peroxidase